MCFGLFFLDSHSQLLYARDIKKSPYQNVVIAINSKVFAPCQYKDGVLLSNNISVKDQRLKDYAPPASCPGIPHNNFIKISTRKESGLKESFYLPIAITKSKDSTIHERCGAVNRCLGHTEAFIGRQIGKKK
jgi:hypothetical protein